MLINNEFIELKKLLESDQWPAAVDSSLICDPNSEPDKLKRAEGILELLIEESLENKKFLDFGCGEGHVPFKSKSFMSFGYDIKEDPHWSGFRSNTVVLTTDIEIIKSNAPYDAILVYDVLDHLEQSNILDTLTQIKNLLSNKGTIYLRVHPFCSRHATHLYQKINKAFVHLIFTTDEIMELGYDCPANAHVMFPLLTYGEFIKKTNLKIKNSNVLRERIEDFFINTPIIRKRMKNNYKDAKFDFPNWQCEQQFLDYVLRK
jgi:2-polyprenyl-3-methyl-5-hydroxy-6-metoxy-1,4-benzoquinol methylase